MSNRKNKDGFLIFGNLQLQDRFGACPKIDSVLSAVFFFLNIFFKGIFSCLTILFTFSLLKKWVAPTTQDATLPADKIRVGGKVYFFCTFLQSINKNISKLPSNLHLELFSKKIWWCQVFYCISTLPTNSFEAVKKLTKNFLLRFFILFSSRFFACLRG